MNMMFFFRKFLQQMFPNRTPTNQVSLFPYSKTVLSNWESNSHTSYSTFSCFLNPRSTTLKSIHSFTGTQIDTSANVPLDLFKCRHIFVSFYSSYTIRKPPSKSWSKRVNKRKRDAFRPSLDESQFQLAVSQLLPRFKPEELHDVITVQKHPLVCLELFNWASQQPRFKHDVCTFHITIKKLGGAKMYEEMDIIVNQLLDIPSFGSEVLYNSIIYFFTEARKLSRAINIYKHMRNSGNLECRPSIRTYNLLFAALLSKRSNSYINHMYMGTIRLLFKQMVNDGVDPDIFSLNSMIKGYVLSLHINDALRIFHQMGVVYDCRPNSYSYDYLIHGLCAQGRTGNARELCNQMKEKGFVPSSKSYNSLVNSFALEGKVEEAVNFLSEMVENQRPADFITYWTVLDEICQQQGIGGAICLLKDLQEKDIVDELTYRKLLYELEDYYGNSHHKDQLG